MFKLVVFFEGFWAGSAPWADRGGLPPRQDALPPRQDALPPRQDALPPRQDALPPRQDALFSPGRMPCSHPGRAGRPGARASFTGGVRPPCTNGVRPPWTNGVRPPWTSMKSRKKTGSQGLQGRLSST